jgi:hypothetical protein
MEEVSIFYVHLVYFTAIWYNLWPFGIFVGYLVQFPPFWQVVPRKIRQPCTQTLCTYLQVLICMCARTVKRFEPRLISLAFVSADTVKDALRKPADMMSDKRCLKTISANAAILHFFNSLFVSFLRWTDYVIIF